MTGETAQPVAKPDGNNLKPSQVETASTVEELQVLEQRRVGGNKAWEPSAAEIAAGCAEIRAGWDAQTERSRRAIPSLPARIPGVDQFGASDGWRADRDDETTE